MTVRALRPLLLVLAGLTAGGALLKVVSLAAPLPEREAPVALRLPGYGVNPIGTSPGRKGRDLSHGTIRRFQLTSADRTADFELTLAPFRGRNSEDLEMAKFKAVVPELALFDRVLTPIGRTDTKAILPSEQVAFGRGPKDSKGAVTRLQTCVTPGGSSGVTQGTLGRQLHQERDQALGPSPLVTKLLRFSGLIPNSRWECMAVQLESSEPTNSHNLVKVWRRLKPSLRP